MTLLITGVDSPLGKAAYRIAKDSGLSPLGTTRLGAKCPINKFYIPTISLDLEQVDKFNINGLKIDSVIHIAAANEGEFSRLVAVNGVGTSQLIDKLKAAGVRRIVHVSSMSVYGAIKDEIVSASTPTRHSTGYGVSKWIAECALYQNSREISAISIRAPAIVGKNSRRNFLARLAEAMKRDDPHIRLSNPNFMFNNVIHTDVLAEFLVNLTRIELTHYDAFPIGSTDPVRLSELVDMLAKSLSYDRKVMWCPSEARTFQIDSSTAILYGYRSISTTQTFKCWIRDLLEGEVSKAN